MRYIGSKRLLLNEIESIVNDNTDGVKSFCDIFSGTSLVARHFKKDFEITSNDFMHYSYVLQVATIENESMPSFNKLKEIIKKDPISYFNDSTVNLKMIKEPPFIYNNYSLSENSERKYFSCKNALKIDFIRQTINEWNDEKLLSKHEYYYLIACLIEAVPFISNITGTYNAFLKHWDNRATKDIKLLKLDVTSNNCDNKSFNMDSNELVKSISGEILYIDPPYSSKQYASNYHLLETISRYDSPAIYGKTGLRPYNHLKSRYCTKRGARGALEDLVKNANFSHIILSYSTEGIIPENDVKEIMMTNGIPSTFYLKRIPYRKFKMGNSFSDSDLHELLFYIKKEV